MEKNRSMQFSMRLESDVINFSKLKNFYIEEGLLTLSASGVDVLRLAINREIKNFEVRK